MEELDEDFYPLADDVHSEELETTPDLPELLLIDVRCNQGPRELLMKLEVNETIPVDEFNLMLLKCSWCTRQARKKDSTVKRIVHKYNLLGEFCGSNIERF